LVPGTPNARETTIFYAISMGWKSFKKIDMDGVIALTRSGLTPTTRLPQRAECSERFTAFFDNRIFYGRDT
jgi:hypothetical protein